jgi:glycosyltransferase involved in cell wall biosynthesis
MTVRLSLAVVTRDHAATIGRALESAASFCDEMIVLDVGSRDATIDIARSHGVVLHQTKWNDDYAAARNESFAHCTGDWIMWLNADDVVPETSLGAFHAIKAVLAERMPQADVIVAPYQWRLDESGTPVVTFQRERLVRRAAGLQWEGRVQERLRIPGDRFGTTGDLIVQRLPDPARLKRDVDHEIEVLEELVTAGDNSPRVLFGYANGLYDQGRYGEAVETYGRYLAVDPHGADRYWAQIFLAECFIVLEDEEAARDVALGAVGEDGSRAEGYMVLGRLAFAEEAWEEAVPMLMAATAATKPQFGLLRESDYSWGPWDYLAVCYDKLGQLNNAIATALRGLVGNPQADRVRANMHWMIDRLL